MFQNILGQAEQDDENEEFYDLNKKFDIKQFIKKAFTKQKILVYIIAFMLSTIECINGITPFAIAIFAACCSNKIPTLIVYILTLLGTLVGLGTTNALTYLLTSMVFVTMILIARPKQQQDYENEKTKLGIFVFLSSFLVQASGILFGSFMIYDLLISIVTALSAYIFYKIFSNSLIVINEVGIKRAFAIEEVIGAGLMLAICASAFREISIFGFEIRTILSILIVLVLGWKNGILLGATSGITIGTILGILQQAEPITIASYALSGMIAGLFSKFGKIGVIIGFVLGNAILAYITNGNTAHIIYFKEILIASLGLLLVPKNITIDIEELFGKTKLLPTGPVNRLEENKETIYKLNNVSEAIHDIANTYQEVAATVIEEEQDEKEAQNKKIFIDELSSKLETIEENILYEDLEEEQIAEDIFRELIKNQTITRKSLIDIFANHNNYIVGFDEVDASLKIEQDIKQAVEIINESYKISKVNFIWSQKINENKRNISNQLDGVSKVISSLAEDIEDKIKEDSHYIKYKQEIMQICKQKDISLKQIEIKKEKTGRYIITTYLEINNEKKDKESILEKLEKILSKVLEEEIVLNNIKSEYKQNNNISINTFISQDKYTLELATTKKTKNDMEVSGDTHITVRLNDGKYLLAISDGMGSGPKAQKSSKIAIKMLEKLLTTGFDKDTSIELINSTLSATSQEENFATLDIAIVDLYAGNIEFIKNAACPTYIKQGKNVQIIKALSLPAGILENISLVVYDKDIEENDIMLMCSDGIMESNTEYQNKELWVKNLLETLEVDNVQKIADIVAKESIDNGFGVAKDDMTAIVAKFIKI